MFVFLLLWFATFQFQKLPLPRYIKDMMRTSQKFFNSISWTVMRNGKVVNRIRQKTKKRMEKRIELRSSASNFNNTHNNWEFNYLKKIKKFHEVISKLTLPGFFLLQSEMDRCKRMLWMNHFNNDRKKRKLDALSWNSTIKLIKLERDKHFM